jgi:hypothetical protein
MTIAALQARIRDALRAVDEEMARHRQIRGRVGTEEQLVQCRRTLETMLTGLESAPLPPRSQRPTGMARMIVDSWPLDSALATLLLEVEQAYLRL